MIIAIHCVQLTRVNYHRIHCAIFNPQFIFEIFIRYLIKKNDRFFIPENLMYFLLNGNILNNCYNILTRGSFGESLENRLSTDRRLERKIRQVVLNTYALVTISKHAVSLSQYTNKYQK